MSDVLVALLSLGIAMVLSIIAAFILDAFSSHGR